MKLEIVFASTPGGGFGDKNKLPWDIPDDMARFFRLTSRSLPGTRNVLIMGRATYEGLSLKPLPGRETVVLSTTASSKSLGVEVVASLGEAIDLIESNAFGRVDRVFAVGGRRVIEEASAFAEVVHVTTVFADIVCDTVIDLRFLDGFTLEHRSPLRRSGGVSFRFERYRRDVGFDHPEMQYLELASRAIASPIRRVCRTGDATRSIFGHVLRFPLGAHTMPLLTTKRVFWRGVVEELLWFIRASTDSKELATRGVHIWDANGSREFLNKLGLMHRCEGDLGPVYGFQWRHFGARYESCRARPEGGVDQLRNVISLLRSDPASRRIVMSAWNPMDLDTMVLPPCHVMVQFLVDEDRLTCIMYQRSGDIGLGIPFNIASYSLLTHMVAHVTNLRAHELVHVIGDAHVYETHVGPLMQQLAREPLDFPSIRFARHVSDIDEFVAEDIELIGYHPHKSIAMKMAV